MRSHGRCVARDVDGDVERRNDRRVKAASKEEKRKKKTICGMENGNEMVASLDPRDIAEELETTKADISPAVIFDQNVVNDVYEEYVSGEPMYLRACNYSGQFGKRAEKEREVREAREKAAAGAAGATGNGGGGGGGGDSGVVDDGGGGLRQGGGEGEMKSGECHPEAMWCEGVCFSKCCDDVLSEEAWNARLQRDMETLTKSTTVGMADLGLCGSEFGFVHKNTCPSYNHKVATDEHWDWQRVVCWPREASFFNERLDSRGAKLDEVGYWAP